MGDDMNKTVARLGVALLASLWVSMATTAAKSVTLEAHFTLHGSMALWTSLGYVAAGFEFKQDDVELATGRIEINGEDPVADSGVFAGALGGATGKGVDQYFVISHSFSVAFDLDANNEAPISWSFGSDGRYGVADFSNDFTYNLTTVGVCCRTNENVNAATVGLFLNGITLAGGAPVSSIGKQVEFIASQTRLHAQATNGADTPQSTISLAEDSALYVQPSANVAGSRIEFLGGSQWRFQTIHEPNPFSIDFADATVGYYYSGGDNLPNIRLVDQQDTGGASGGAGVPLPATALLLIGPLLLALRRRRYPVAA